MKGNVIAVSLACLLASSDAMCPNRCSNHGSCGPFDRCTCHDGWTNGDCSQRVCPYGASWADVADTSVSGRDAHYYEECSGKGSCDRELGICECLEGFEGSACQRMSCPLSCSGHGTCETLGAVNSYTAWDADKIQVCVCDAGWEGNGCEKRSCKLGDDPLSVFDSSGSNTETDETQSIQIALLADTDTESTYVIEYTDWKGETYKTWPIEFPITSHSVEEALKGLPNNAIPDVTVGTVTENTANRDYTVVVTFSSADTPGNQPTLNVLVEGCNLDGCQPAYYGVYSGTRTAVATATVTPTDGTAERLECSKRGTCNYETGICDCFEGYYGDSCNKQTVIM